MRGINWPAGFHEFVSNCLIHMLVYVWSKISCCGWLNLSLEFNFAARHAKPRYMKLQRHNDLINARYYHWRFVNNFNCSNHDVTMVSGSQATGRTCNDHSGSKVLKKGATRYSIVIDCNYESSCWVHYWTSTAMCVSYFELFDNGNCNWCKLGMAFFCGTGHFCVGRIFVSNLVFLCRTSLFVPNECYNGRITYESYTPPNHHCSTSSHYQSQWGHFINPLQRRHGERDGAWNHRRLDCWLNRLFRRRSKKTSKLRVTGLCGENSSVSWWQKWSKLASFHWRNCTWIYLCNFTTIFQRWWVNWYRITAGVFTFCDYYRLDFLFVLFGVFWAKY